jgi:hypothetical protein
VFETEEKGSQGAGGPMVRLGRMASPWAPPNGPLTFSGTPSHTFHKKNEVEKISNCLRPIRFLKDQIYKTEFPVLQSKTQTKMIWWKIPQMTINHGWNFRYDANMLENNTINYEVHGYMSYVLVVLRFCVIINCDINTITKLLAKARK